MANIVIYMYIDICGYLHVHKSEVIHQFMVGRMEIMRIGFFTQVALCSNVGQGKWKKKS